MLSQPDSSSDGRNWVFFKLHHRSSFRKLHLKIVPFVTNAEDVLGNGAMVE